MHNYFSNLLASSPNGGGIFLIHEGRFLHLDNLDTTGLFIGEDKIVRAYQPDELCICGDKLVSVTNRVVPFDDIHDVYCDAEHIYLVGTSGNEIIKLTHHGEEIQRWTFPGEKDSWHINCICNWNGRIVFSAFGEFKHTQGYKGHTDRSGFVQDLLSGERVITGLSQPHTLIPIGENLLLANSERMEVLEFALSGGLLRSKQLDGYVRGIAIDKETVYVGLSRSRNVEDVGLVSAAIVALDVITLEEQARLNIPINEIYGIVHLNGQKNVINALGAVAISTSSRLNRMLADKENQIVNINKAFVCRDNQIVSLSQTVVERDSQVASLSQTVVERDSQIAGLNEAITESDSQIVILSQTVAERDRQIASLSQTVAERKSQIAGLNEVITERNRQIVELDLQFNTVSIQLNSVLTSKSWKLMEPLRYLRRMLKL